MQGPDSEPAVVGYLEDIVRASSARSSPYGSLQGSPRPRHPNAAAWGDAVVPVDSFAGVGPSEAPNAYASAPLPGAINDAGDAEEGSPSSCGTSTATTVLGPGDGSDNVQALVPHLLPGPPRGRRKAPPRLLLLPLQVAGLCVASTLVFGAVLAFGVTTTDPGNLLYALVVHGRTAVQVDCATWRNTTACPGGAAPPLLGRLQSPPAFWAFCSLTLLCYGLLMPVSLQLLFPPPWPALWTAAAWLPQALAFAACTAHQLLREDTDGAWAAYAGAPVLWNLLCFFAMNAAAPPARKVVRSWRELGCVLAIAATLTVPLLQLVLLNRLRLTNDFCQTTALIVVTRCVLAAVSCAERWLLTLVPRVPMELALALLLGMQLVIQGHLRAFIFALDDLAQVALSSALMGCAEVGVNTAMVLFARWKIRRHRRAGAEAAAQKYELLALVDLVVVVAAEAVAVWISGVRMLTLDPQVWRCSTTACPCRTRSGASPSSGASSWPRTPRASRWPGAASRCRGRPCGRGPGSAGCWSAWS